MNGDGYADVIVGAPATTTAQTDEGRAFVYLRLGPGCATPCRTSPRTGSTRPTRSSAGRSARPGDVNGDGYADVIVGAPGYDNGRASGAAFVYHGSAAGLDGTDRAGCRAPRRPGDPVRLLGATAGDVNGDGYADVDRRRALLRRRPDRRGPGLRLSTARPRASTHVAGLDGRERPGRRRSSATRWARPGDVNGDGYADVIVGAPVYDANGAADEGRAVRLPGSAAGLRDTAAWTRRRAQAARDVRLRRWPRRAT